MSLYRDGKNIIEMLRQVSGLSTNSKEIIEIAYDLQAGSYVSAMEEDEYRNHKNEYTAELARIISSLGETSTLLEAGVGEATTLAGVLEHLPVAIQHAFGFDLSWSRIAVARSWLQRENIPAVTLCTGDLLHIPFSENSIDIVYTSHSIEPNGGNELPILQELYRVTRKYLILLEPGYELASREAQNRMKQHGYCRGLVRTAEDLGYEVLEHKIFPYVSNLMNPTALTLIRKCADGNQPDNFLACPKFQTPLEKMGDHLYSPEALVVYPVLDGIPCLRIENGIIASRYSGIVREE
jgi:ubiquinone/menaquinone biosynthesis C-methylase UbiE